MPKRADFGVPLRLGPKMDPKSPKADLKIINKHIGFYSISELGRVQGAAWEASKNGSKNGGGCVSSDGPVLGCSGQF